MIVKDEAAVLSRCLDSLKVIADEIIIIDTGSSDMTKEIALNYTDKVYAYKWQNDFAHARNYSFSKATKDYIYTADADEIIDKVNIERFMKLKMAMLSEVEIVQMKYTNQLQFGTTYNYETEYRPKLFKRLREFVWINPIHETINTEPIIFDSDIEIIHMPVKSHANRDFKHILKLIESGIKLSKKLYIMFAKELYIAGETQDFLDVQSYFEYSLENELRSEDEIKAAQCILTKCGRLTRDYNLILKNSLKNLAEGRASAEVCYEVGEYFFQNRDYNEATIWFYNAAFETECELNIHYAGDYPLKRLVDTYRAIGDEMQESEYRKLLEEWVLPQSTETK